MSRSEKRISTEEIKDRWEEIYRKYVHLQKDGKSYVGLCPLHQEKTPSFNVFGKGAFKCFGCGKSGGSVIDFVMEKEGIDFKDAIALIIKDNNISPTGGTIIKRPKIIQKETLIEWNIGKFEAKHRKYWNKYLLPESYLNRKNIFAVRKLAYNKKVIDIENEAVFVYIAEDINKPKILRIGENVTKKMKWRNTIPNNYLFYFPKEKIETLFIAKSVKDAVVLNYHFGLECCAVQSESALTLLEYNYERLQNIANNKVVAFGNDFQAWHESLLITEYTGWNYFNIPNYMEAYGVNDFAAMVEVFGVEPLNLLLKKKNFI